MNYRHIYHAGNFADVLKHAVLALIIEYLKLKPGPFRVIDTHAGIGLYDLASEQAQKTGEWRNGIARLLNGPPLPGQVGDILAPYLAVVRALNPGGDVVRYPGSPLLARRLMRHDDQLIVNELHPEDAAVLRHIMSSEPSSKMMELDGYVALKAVLPPKERRGLVIIDPPFEETDELDKLVKAVVDFNRRFATGTLVIWYPIKDTRIIEDFHTRLAKLGLQKLLRVDLMIRQVRRTDVLNGCGLAVINPPFTLAGTLEALMPFLARCLEQEPGGSYHLEGAGVAS